MLRSFLLCIVVAGTTLEAADRIQHQAQRNFRAEQLREVGQRAARVLVFAREEPISAPLSPQPA